MNYGDLPKRVLKKVMQAISIINNIEIEPVVRQRNMEILFEEVGREIYNKVYEMNAWDMEIAHTSGKGIDNRHYGLAKIAAGAPVTKPVGLEAQILNYMQEAAAKAQDDAFEMARQSGKHPTVTRSLRGETCDWCKSLVGVYVNPEPDVFKRHSSCDCQIVTEGYMSRNGLLENYKK